MQHAQLHHHKCECQYNERNTSHCTATSCGGVFVTTQRTNVFFIIITIIYQGAASGIYNGPNMQRHMVPWTIRLIPYLPPNAKLHEMHTYAHTLVQLTTPPCQTFLTNPQCDK